MRMQTTYPKPAALENSETWHAVERAVRSPLRLLSVLVAEDGTRYCVVERSALPDQQELQRRFGLTAREAEVALMLADRPTNREIAQALNISLHTVRSHVEHVLGKLDVNSRNDVRRALSLAM